MNLLAMIPKGKEADFHLEFNHVVNDLAAYNSKENMVKRIEFALKNTYSHNLNKIQAACKCEGITQ